MEVGGSSEVGREREGRKSVPLLLLLLLLPLYSYSCSRTVHPDPTVVVVVLVLSQTNDTVSVVGVGPETFTLVFQSLYASFSPFTVLLSVPYLIPLYLFQS